jgi:hypothetical protein
LGEDSFNANKLYAECFIFLKKYLPILTKDLHSVKLFVDTARIPEKYAERPLELCRSRHISEKLSAYFPALFEIPRDIVLFCNRSSEICRMSEGIMQNHVALGLMYGSVLRLMDRTLKQECRFYFPITLSDSSSICGQRTCHEAFSLESSCLDTW